MPTAPPGSANFNHYREIPPTTKPFNSLQSKMYATLILTLVLNHNLYIMLTTYRKLGLLAICFKSYDLKAMKTQIFFLKDVFVGLRCILWSHWCPLFQTLDDSAHEFQSQGGFIITCVLLSLTCNDPQSSLVTGPSIKPRSFTCEVSMIPLSHPGPVQLTDRLTDKRTCVKPLPTSSL